MRRRLAMLLVVVPAVVAPGCGGDDGGEAGAAVDAGLSNARLVAQAKEVCARSRRRLARGLATYVPPEVRRSRETVPSADTFAGTFRKIGLPAIEQQATELRRLAAQHDDDAFTSYLAELERALRGVERQSEVTGPEFLAAFARSTEMAKAYGLGTCTLG